MLGFCAGMVGGMVYVCSFVLLYEEKKIPQKHKEFCISMVTLAYSFALLTSSVSGYCFNRYMGV
jgi:hypothetical protein